jgi:leucyl aminopeptidase
LTAFDALLIADRGADRDAATMLVLVDAAGHDAWRATLPAAARAALTAAGFSAAPDSIGWMGEGGASGDAGYAIGVRHAAGPGRWCLAAAAAKLPPGRYRLAADPGLAAHGWLLAQHGFTLYRTDAAAAPRTLLVPPATDVDGAVLHAEAAALARDLIDTPANAMGPAELETAMAPQWPVCAAPRCWSRISRRSTPWAAPARGSRG